MIVAADAVDPDALSFEIFGPLDIRAGDDAMRQVIFYGADENKILRSLDIRADDADPSNQAHVRITAD